MKKILSLFLCTVLVLSFASCSDNTVGDETGADSAGKTFYVSPDGNDENDGSKENPLASMNGAVQAVRSYKAENGLPEGGIEVIFSAGVYSVTETIPLSLEDSGEEGKSIVYRAEDGAEVIFDGGIALNAEDFVPANEEIKKRIVDDAARKALLEIDLTIAGCYDLRDLSSTYGTTWNSDKYRQELYVDNKRQTLAQWPNGDPYETVGSVYSDTNDSHYRIPEEKAALWKGVEGQIDYYGAPVIEWDKRFVFRGGVSIDEEKNTLVLKGAGFTPGDSPSLWVYNIPEEIDMPGEYWWDTETNKLYYYPDGDLTGKKIRYSQLATPFFTPSDTHYITFDGFTFENFRSPILFNEGDKYIRNSHFTMTNCIFRCTGVNGIGFFCDYAVVTNNEFYEIGSSGINIRSGDNSAFKNTNTVISKNHIHDYSQNYKVFTYAIYTDGIGFLISHNEIHNGNTGAIGTNSAETVVEYNDIYDICHSMNDGGAIALGGRWDWCGNEIRYNYIHDSDSMGVYIDDMVSGQHIYGNVIANSGGNGITIGSGKYNVIENNLLINCAAVPISNDQRGLGFAAPSVVYPNGYMWDTLINSNLHSDIMRLARPCNLLQVELSTTSSIHRLDDPGICSYTVVRGNVAYNCMSDAKWQDRAYGDIYTDTITVDGVINLVPMARLYCTTEGNMYYPDVTDIGFNDPQNGDYSLDDSSRIYRDILGFEKIPFDKIGIVSDN